MYQDKSCTCTQISIAVFFCEKSIITRCLCSVIAYFRKFLTITQLRNIISSTSRTGFLRLNTISSSRNTSKLHCILVSQITAVAIIRILITSSSCHSYLLCALCGCFSCHKGNGFSFIQRIKVNSFLSSLFHHIRNSQTSFFICCRFRFFCKISHYFCFCLPVRLSIICRSGILRFSGVAFTNSILRRICHCYSFRFRFPYRHISADMIRRISTDRLYLINCFIGIRPACIKILTFFVLRFVQFYFYFCIIDSLNTGKINLNVKIRTIFYGIITGCHNLILCQFIFHCFQFRILGFKRRSCMILLCRISCNWLKYRGCNRKDRQHTRHYSFPRSFHFSIPHFVLFFCYWFTGFHLSDTIISITPF